MPLSAIPRRAGRGLPGFMAFAGAYALPVWPFPSTGALTDSETNRALLNALASPAVLGGVALNLATHLGLLTLFYTALTWLARQLARATQVSAPLCSVLILVVGWIWLVSGNAVVFGRSNYSVPLAAVADPTTFGLCSVVLAGIGGVVLWHGGRTLLTTSWRFAAAGLGIPMLLVVAWPAPDAQAVPTAPRNIVIIGVDSLSAPLMQREQARLPHLSQLLTRATRYERAYTPLGRTYPAWVSILSGHAPAVHGALFNLRGVEHAERQDLLSRVLHAQGYRTVYAIDERRFNNIDESFGFDRIVGPQAGVLDFALQSANDTPLTNLLLQTRAAGWLLPYSRLNVASVANYDARGFVNEIGRASAGPQPLFLAVHFLSGHFPFATRHATLAHPDPNSIRAHHVESLTAADAQVGWLMDRLAAQGRLDDAMVIVLSDHGEALGDAEPVQLESGEVAASSSYGHGADLLSEHQNRIVLATLRYRHGQPVPAAAPSQEQVSLLDVRAAVEGFVRNGTVELKAGSDCIPVETELRLAAAEDYRHLDTHRVAAEGISLYEIDEQGRLRLREERLASLIAEKDVGWRCADRLTVYQPRSGRYRAYRLTSGAPPTEQSPTPADIQHIEQYRQQLREAGEKASRNAHARVG